MCNKIKSSISIIIVKQKFGDLDDHGRNTEEDFDKLKDEIDEEDSQEDKADGEEESPAPETPAKKKSATPKVRF